LAVGLLRYTPEMYQLPPGFYGIDSIFLLLGLIALARIQSLEQLRYQCYVHGFLLVRLAGSHTTGGGQMPR